MPNGPSEPPYDPRYDRPGDPRFDRREEPGFGAREGPRGDRFYGDGFDDGRRDDAGYPPENGRRPRSRARLFALIAAGLALLLVALFAYRLTRTGPGEDRLGDEASAGNVAGGSPAAERCGTQRTYDLVKQELFRRAAQERGSDQSAFDRLSAYASVRVEAPVLKRQDEALGTQVCGGRVSIDLPPGVAVVGGRRTLTADMDYALQPAADRSGDVVTLSGAEPIVVPLATLARTGSQPGLPQPQPSAQVPGVPPVPAPSASPDPVVPASPEQPAPPEGPTPPPAPQPSASARPSFNCANARTRGEIAVCNDSGLAALDRQMAGFYGRSFSQANATQRALLQRTRGTFLNYRDGCRNDTCIAGAYRDRIREIADIMADRWVAPR